MAETYPAMPATAGRHDPTAGTPPVQQPQAHEHSDIATRPLWIFGGAFLILMLVIMVGLYVLFFAYERGELELDKDRTGSLVKPTDTGPPEPRLQGIPGFHINTPREDTDQMEQEDMKRLNTYGPAQDGFARIPIDRAIELLLQRGLPIQSAATQPSTRPATQGGPNAR